MVQRLGRTSILWADLARTAHAPFRALIVVIAVRLALRFGVEEFGGRATILHILLLAVIAASAWLVAALLLVIEDFALTKWRTDVPDNLRARRLKTQVVMLRRVTVAAVVVIRMLPPLLLPGALAHRLERRSMLVAADVLQAVLVVSVVFAVGEGVAVAFC